ncbi:MAG: hypothetical protein HY308_14215 [Gammaproteobacteria bacterium]|nr:hypothetical protein [Gammaproteobacteria bacterium]
MKDQLLRNAEEINRLHRRIHDTFKEKNKNEHKKREWQQACKEFHERYPTLAFPGGLNGAYERILTGESGAVEAALFFLECRPYFFRSGYIFKDILRKLKKAPLHGEQRSRFEVVLEKYNEYRKQRQRSA